jgi:Spy/CpxP family protein refolding chaperone
MRKSAKTLMAMTAVATLVAMLSADAFAQPGGRGGRGGGGGFGGPGGFGGGRLGMLGRDDVKRDLEIVPDQEDKLRDLQEEMRDRMREQFEGLRDLSDEERREAFTGIREKMEKITAEIDKDIDGILMPDQRAKLDQRVLAQSVQFGGAGALTNSTAARALGLTEDQRKKLEEKAREVQEELQAKIEKLREDAEDEILAVLSPDQREKVKKLISERPEGGTGRGGRGGRGGNNNNP